MLEEERSMRNNLSAATIAVIILCQCETNIVAAETAPARPIIVDAKAGFLTCEEIKMAQLDTSTAPASPLNRDTENKPQKPGEGSGGDDPKPGKTLDVPLQLDVDSRHVTPAPGTNGE
jgi:hypothetical protein